MIPAQHCSGTSMSARMTKQILENGSLSKQSPSATRTSPCVSRVLLQLIFFFASGWQMKIFTWQTTKVVQCLHSCPCWKLHRKEKICQTTLCQHGQQHPPKTNGRCFVKLGHKASHTAHFGWFVLLFCLNLQKCWTASLRNLWEPKVIPFTTILLTLN